MEMSIEEEMFLIALRALVNKYSRQFTGQDAIIPLQLPAMPLPYMPLPTIPNLNIYDDGHKSVNAVSTKEISASAPDFDGQTILSHGVAHNE